MMNVTDLLVSFSYLTQRDNVKNFDKNNLLICIIVTTWTIPMTFNISSPTKIVTKPRYALLEDLTMTMVGKILTRLFE